MLVLDVFSLMQACNWKETNEHFLFLGGFGVFIFVTTYASTVLSLLISIELVVFITLVFLEGDLCLKCSVSN